MFDVSRPNDTSDAPGKPVLFAGYGGSPTGYARVIHSLLRFLPSHYQLHHFAPDLSEAAQPCGWQMYANANSGGVYDNTQFRAVIESVKPKLIVLVDEPWMWFRRAPATGETPCLFYAAIDSEKAYTPVLASSMSGLRGLAVFTRFAENVVKKTFSMNGISCPPLSVIPHGIDPGLFYPVANDEFDGSFEASRREARRNLFADSPDFEDAFIVLNANRNQPNKRIDLTIEGFALFAQNKPKNVKLWLHMATRKGKPGSKPLVDRLGIRNRLLTTIAAETHPNISSVMLNLVYNACDVGLNTSEREAWGMIAFEHASTGSPQVMLRHGVSEELWGDAAEFIEPPLTATAVAAALERLYTDRKLRKAKAEAAFNNARRSEYNWKSIANRWDELLRPFVGL